MSYQIKSTPFFRRMLSTSKKNGQLQKLKEEYERMKDFNERTIEMKMREVRLKRLFKDIEDIKELSYHLPKRSRTSNRNKTPEQIRGETLRRAKELGKEFSKLNGLLAPSTSKSCSKDKSSQFLYVSEMQKERKHLVAKAKNYGNETSRANLLKQGHVLRRTNSRKRDKLQTDNELKESDKHKNLKQRLRYGNSRSHINMSKVPKRDAKHRIVTEHTSTFHAKTGTLRQQCSNKSFIVPIAPNLCELERECPKSLNTSATFLHENASNTNSIVSSTAAAAVVNNFEAHLRAKKYWRKVALTVLNRFDKAIRLATKSENGCSDDTTTDNEFALRTISNDTDLTSSTIISEKKNRGALEMGANEPEPNEDDEVLLHIEPLYTPPTSLSGYLTSAFSTPQPTDPVNTAAVIEKQANILETIKDLSDKVASYEAPRPSSDKVHQLAKIFEPFVREAAQKEAFDGVQKLKSIFESQESALKESKSKGSVPCCYASEICSEITSKTINITTNGTRIAPTMELLNLQEISSNILALYFGICYF